MKQLVHWVELALKHVEHNDEHLLQMLFESFMNPYIQVVHIVWLEQTMHPVVHRKIWLFWEKDPSWFEIA